MGLFGGNDKDEEFEMGERALEEAERDQEERDRLNDELLERIKRKAQQDEESETRQQAQEEDFREKARERDTAQQEYEDALRQAREKVSEEEARAETEEKPQTEAGETYEESLTRERREQLEDLQYRKDLASFRPKPKTAQELRIEELQQKALESKYTKTGQLKSRLEGTAKGFLKGDKSGKTDRMSGVAGRATKVVRNIATLGGAVTQSKARKHLYVPKADLDYYVPGKSKIGKGPTSLYSASGMKELHMPPSPPSGKPGMASMGGSSLRRAGTPDYGALRQATTFKSKQAPSMQPRTTQSATSPLAKMSARTPTHLAKPMGFVKIGAQAQDVAMERLRGLSFPRGLTNTEKLAYAEIKANHDIDTKSHVVSELMDLGIDKMEALRSVEGLMQRRIVKRGQTFAGEPALEIA